MSFFKKLLGKKEEKDPKRRGSVKDEVQKNQASTTTLEEDDEDDPKDLERVDTYAGPLAKFLLKFIYIEDGYHEIEKAFLNSIKNNKKLLKLKKSKSIKSKMELKQSSNDIPNMLILLGFNKLNIKQIQDICNKDIKNQDKVIICDDKHEISFRRFLIAVGQIYFNIKSNQAKLDSDNDNDNNNNNNNNNNDDDIKNEDNNNNNNNVNNNNKYKDIYNKVAKGFDVVQDMFNYIDKDGSGYIDKDEFTKVFAPSLRGPEKKKLIKERMDEMDYNKDGQISFNEFIFGISQWIKWDYEDDNNDIDDDLEIDDDEEIADTDEL